MNGDFRDSLEVLNRSSGVTYAGSDWDLCVRFRRLFSRKEIRKVKKVQRVGMKGIELRLICELMKNSKRSDRELAKVLGVSQPTVSRLVKKLERGSDKRIYHDT